MGMDKEWRELHKRVRNEPSFKRKFGASFRQWFVQIAASKVLIGGSGLKPPCSIKTALKKTNHLDKSQAGQLLLDVLLACYQAATYTDLDKTFRENCSEVLLELPSQIKAIDKITKFMRRYPTAGSMALAQTVLEWKNKKLGYGLQFFTDEKFSPPFATIFEDFLNCYADELKQGIIGIKSGNFLPRFKAGPLLYPKPLDQQRAQPNPQVSGLLFHLTFLYRFYTSPNPQGRRQLGAPMPKTGKPCLPLVTLLTNATLGKDLSEQDVRSQINSLTKKGVTLLNW